jgi:hypothetical protein
VAPQRGWRPLLFLTLLAVGLTGCASDRPGPAAADTAARDFYRAIADGDGPKACALLAPATVEALEDDTDQACDQAILDGDVGDTLTSRAQDAADPSATTAGRQAQVRLTTDVVFLTVSGSSWAITAAGCDARPDRPYDCVLEAS